ncbi:type II secretion system minor pseudopilin GspH [Gayadomonas joobiniege]|uniref:type II secretion system minor pseudopilin GspH n=1 Tax=Gayadomonas joobiniege TaxID=1234606 RepID=UPI00035DD9EA|nr:type II secretion system minor pseudopilin GspH [Gayadomonas joobiniege]
MKTASFNHKKYQHGFTLLEVMLVMVLLAVMVSSISLSFDLRSPYDKVKDEARRFQAAFQLASDYALLNSFQLGLVVDKATYQFVAFDGDNWQTLEDDKSLSKHELSQEIELSLTMQQIDWLSDQQQDEGIFSVAGSNEEDSDTGQDNKDKIIPQVYLFSSGEYIPSEFSLTFTWVGDSEQTLFFEVTGAGGFPLKISDTEGQLEQ